MPTVNLSRSDSGAGLAIRWASMANGDDGQWIDTQAFRDISVQVTGTFGSGGTLLIEGSNEATPTNAATLNDPQGNAISVQAAKIEQVLESVRWIRPRVSAGDGTTSLTVNLWGGRSIR